MANSYQKARLINGAFQDSSGNPLSLGKLVWTLSHDSNVATLGGPTGSQVASGINSTAYLDMNGNIAGTFYLWTNDVLTPAGSYYTVRAYNSSGLEIWATPQTFTLVYATTIDVGTLQPQIP